ncbi:hypothetical protein [Actinoplanes sp. NPDC051494]|uniref:hypothetical protein n=1 Tax=Actinoplanes sp. NPDC051494 TaxID=3363907 RepID=UPI0037B6B793
MHPTGPMPMAPPPTMRLSSALLFTAGGLTILKAAYELVFTNTDLSVYRDAYTGGTGSGFASLAGATFGIFFAAGACILAILNSRGRHPARVVTLVLGWLFLVCGGFGSLAGRFHRPAGSAGDSTFTKILPAAYGTGVGVLDVLIFLAVLAATVLTVLPPSNRFFQNRKLTAYAQVLMTQTGMTYPPQYHPHTPPPFQAPAQPPQPPHTTSIPAIDPWAEGTGRHQA